MSDFLVTLTYPVIEEIDGLGTIHTTRTEQWHFDIYGDAWDQYKIACGRLGNLGLFAQADLISQGYVTHSRANAPDKPLDHPLVAELEAKMRAKGQRP
jgi:hypothetical protein